MNHSKSIYWAACIGVAALSACAFFLLPRDGRPVGSSAQTLVTPAPDALRQTDLRVPAFAQPGTTSGSTPGHTPAARSLLQAYNTATDYRSFALESRRHPEAGGIYYASAVTTTCRGMLNASRLTTTAQPEISTTSDASIQTAQIAAHDLMRRRCQGFAENEMSAQNDRELRIEAETRGDVLWRLNSDFQAARQSGSTESLNRALDAIFEHPDGLLLDDLGVRLGIGSDASGRTAIWFDGVAYPVRDDPAIVMAFQIVPCHFGLACDATDPALAIACATQGQCAASRQEALRSTLMKSNPGRIDEVMSWTSRIVDAIRTRRVEAFTSGR